MARRLLLLVWLLVLSQGEARDEDSLQHSLDLKLAALAAAHVDGGALYKEVQGVDDDLKAAEAAIHATLAELDAKVQTRVSGSTSRSTGALFPEHNMPFA